MARDAFRILRTVRLRSVEAARHVLGECLMGETHAQDLIRAIDDRVQRDRAAQPSLAEAYRFVDMFARRVDVGETERRAATAALTTAEARTAEARAALAAARAAAEAVETLIAERIAADQADANRREQHALDDMARTRLDRANRSGANKLR